MKNLTIVIFILIQQINFCQTEEQLIEEILSNSTSFKEIQKTIEILENNYQNTSEFIKKIPSIFPIQAKNQPIITSTFGTRTDPLSHKFKKHLGIDVGAKIGTTVHATADGTIEEIEFKKTGYGRKIILKHSYGFKTVYAHLSIILIKKDQKNVSKGEIIALVGSTGKSTGYHLHYEILKNNKHINPLPSFFIEKTEK